MDYEKILVLYFFIKYDPFQKHHVLDYLRNAYLCPDSNKYFIL